MIRTIQSSFAASLILLTAGVYGCGSDQISLSRRGAVTNDQVAPTRSEHTALGRSNNAFIPIRPNLTVGTQATWIASGWLGYDGCTKSGNVQSNGTFSIPLQFAPGSGGTWQ